MSGEGRADLGFRLLAALGVVVLFLILLWEPSKHCRPAEYRYGIRVMTCPDGEARQELRLFASGLRRGGTGQVTVEARAAYTTALSDEKRVAPVESFDVSLALVDAKGKEHALEPEDGWKRSSDRRVAEVALPEVPDGDYELRATVKSKIGEGDVSLPLAIYAPARIHVLTDRPLYEPDSEVLFRALAVRASDLTPIDHRPGTWLVRDSEGQVLLEEKGPAGEWGVARGSFPLASEAPAGDWSVTWRSGEDEATATFRVEPFTLPRFRVEAAPERPFYRAGERPVLAGRVVYTSGAPVAGAAIEIQWRASGEWPPPTAWLGGELPQTAETGPGGRFRLELPEVPEDLRKQARLHASLGAVDPAGDRVSGAATILLSEDAIQVQALTELDDRLVEGANNRVFLRVVTAAGRPLAGARIRVKRAWDPGDEGEEAELDADGVARLQIDPGPPVSVVVPPMPEREPVAGAPGQIALEAAQELVAARAASLDDRLAIERWLDSLRACGKWVPSSSQSVEVVLRVSRAGAVTRSADGGSPLAACVRSVLAKKRLPAGRERLYRLRFGFPDPQLPRLSFDVVDPLGTMPALRGMIARAALDARDCLPQGFEGSVPGGLAWEMVRGRASIAASWVEGDGGATVPPGLTGCITGRVARAELPEPAESGRLGLVRFAVQQPAREGSGPAPQPTVVRGYELLVSAEEDGEPVGETKLLVLPGELPALRVRAEPVVAEPGDEVSVELIRGPSFSGELPDEIVVEHLDETREVGLDKETRTARFTLPEEAEGWFEVRARGQRALVFVRPQSQLEVTVAPDKERYAPGSEARLAVKTSVAGGPSPAAVGLFGVDKSLGQLATLPEADALAALRSRATMAEPAFGVLDAEALAVGKIRGRFATEAAVLRVSRVPEPPEVDAVVGGEARYAIDPVAELTEAFYPLLGELHAQTRLWERTAPESELMTPETMATLWDQALDVAAARGERIEDAYGRRIRLHRLPEDLLALTAPNQVVVEGTRLPEDVENWSGWVKEEQP